VGGRVAPDEHRGAERHGIRPERGELLLRRRERGCDRAELVADPSGAVRRWVVFHLASVAPLVALDGRHGAVTAFLAVLVGGVGGLIASVIATAVVAVILRELDAGHRILAGQAYRRVLGRWRSLTRGMATELGMVLVLTMTVVGIPFAIHRFIRWSLFAEACMLDDLSATESLRRSSQLVKGRWWRTFGFTVLIERSPYCPARCSVLDCCS
jgi:hypothetical protein